MPVYWLIFSVPHLLTPRTNVPALQAPTLKHCVPGVKSWLTVFGVLYQLGHQDSNVTVWAGDEQKDYSFCLAHDTEMLTV